jgi:HSP20 family molecular chaperone IbpA
MLLLRRSRPARSVASNVEIEMTFDLEPEHGRRRHDCKAPWRPPIEVFETGESLVVRAEIGGLAEGQLHVEVNADELHIRGERTMPMASASRTYHESRLRYGPFAATIRVPFPVDVPNAAAEYIDGFLTIKLPRLTPTTIAAREKSRPTDARRGEQ